MIKKIFIVATLPLGFIPSEAGASGVGQITVVDCQSMPRAAGKAENTAAVELKFSSDISKALLTEVASSKKIEVALHEGAAVFEGVQAGTWSACQPGTVQADSIALRSTDGAPLAAAIPLGGVVAGGLALAAGGDSNESASPALVGYPEAGSDLSVVKGNPVTVASANNSTSAPVGGSRGSYDSGCFVGMAAVSGCRDNESPAPLSPFS